MRALELENIPQVKKQVTLACEGMRPLCHMSQIFYTKALDIHVLIELLVHVIRCKNFNSSASRNQCVMGST